MKTASLVFFTLLAGCASKPPIYNVLNYYAPPRAAIGPQQAIEHGPWESYKPTASPVLQPWEQPTPEAQISPLAERFQQLSSEDQDRLKAEYLEWLKTQTP